MISENKKHGREVDDSDLQRAFTLFTSSSKSYIDPESTEGKAITESINKANALMESLRPPWKKRHRQTKELGTVGQIPSPTAPEHEIETGSKRQISKQPANSTAIEEPSVVAFHLQPEPRRSLGIQR